MYIYLGLVCSPCLGLKKTWGVDISCTLAYTPKQQPGLLTADAVTNRQFGQQLSWCAFCMSYSLEQQYSDFGYDLTTYLPQDRIFAF